MITNSETHLSEALMQKLLQGDSEDAATEHLEHCSKCRGAMEAMAAAPQLWQKVAELSSAPHLTPCSLEPWTESGSPSEDADDFITELSFRDLLDEPSHPDWLGSLGGYDVEKEIGRGGMGVVFKAYDRELNRILAIKVLAPWLAQNGAARQRFAREARAAAAVIHSNVVPIYGISSSEKTPYLVMPYVAGPSLQRLVDEHGPLEEKEIVRIALQVSGALGAAHAQGLVHRDIKPANILVESDINRVLVTDFGLARAVDDASATQSGFFAGTPNYMSPEQALGRRVDSRSDLFSLGSVIYFMATGRLPFRADSPISVLHRITHDQPKDVRGINCDISQTLSRIILTLHEKDVEDRLQTVGELHQLLERYLAYLHQPDISQPPVIPCRTSEPEQEKDLQPTRKRTRTAFVSLAASALTALGLAMGVGWLPLPGWLPLEASTAQAQAPNQLPVEGADPESGDSAPQEPQSPNDAPGELGSGSNSGGSSSGGSSSGGSSSGASVSDRSEVWPELIADEGIPGTFVTVEKEYADQQIDGYTLYLPTSFSEETGPHPVIIFLHGGLLVGGEVSRVNGWGIPLEVKKHREEASQLATYLSDTFIIACPHLVRGEFYQNASAIREIINEILAKYKADASRVYLTGLSRGGSGTWGLASKMPDVFAAAAPIGGRTNGIGDIAPLSRTSLWIAHNSRDDVTPYEPVANIALKLEEMDNGLFHRIDLAGDPDLSELKQPRVFTFRDTTNHNAWTEVYKSPHFYRWLLKQSLSPE